MKTNTKILVVAVVLLAEFGLFMQKFCWMITWFRFGAEQFAFVLFLLLCWLFYKLAQCFGELDDEGEEEGYGW